MSKPRLIVWTLNIGDYAPAVRELCTPLQRFWAHKIGAEYREITERKFPDFPVVYEKLQLHELGKASEWTIFLDADALVHPDMFDPTCHLPKDTIAHHGRDMANIRWRYDGYFWRDGRNFGSCNWCTMASEWCLDLWKPLDITLEEALAQIHPTADERSKGCCETSHLIDDFTLSRNIARFGLKATTVMEMCGDLLGTKMPDGRGYCQYFHHLYNCPDEKKLDSMLNTLCWPNIQRMMQNGQPDPRKGWGIWDPLNGEEFRAKWKVRRLQEMEWGFIQQ